MGWKMKFPRTPAGRWETFWDSIEKTETCWLWKGKVSPCGYGYLLLQGGRYSAHRLMLFWMNRLSSPRHMGSRSEGLVMHSCDNKLCVNPAHLSVGTNSQNVSDAYARGAAAGMQGTKSVLAKLTAEQVTDIRAAYARGELTQYKLAEMYSVCQRTINKIVRMESYKEDI